VRFFDTLTTVNAYNPVDAASAGGLTSGWVHKQPTAVTVDAGQPTALTATVVYDERADRSGRPSLARTVLMPRHRVGVLHGRRRGVGRRLPRKAGMGRPAVRAGAAGAVTGHNGARMAANSRQRVSAYNAFGSPTVVTEAASS